jgi:hypothetical protein
MQTEPTMVGGAAALDVNNDANEAYQKLSEMAEEQRRRSPTLTVAQAFARVFEKLAARAHKRPAATTSYAFPR